MGVRLRGVVTTVLVVLVAACAPPGEPASAPAPGSDGGPEQVAAGVPASNATPDLRGRTAADAEAAVTAAGGRLLLLVFDVRGRITRQTPAPGAPLSGPVTAWVGEAAVGDVPPATAASPPLGAAGSATPAQAAPRQAPPTTPAPTPPVAQPAAGPAGYVLPPHAGLLRTNPRRLPALPPGTRLRGLASWYGPGFAGNRTACGQIYDPNGPTLAARELRCGTVVRITGPTGETVEATVTDWGPAEWTGRRFDLSAAVFNAIAPLGAGVVPVTVHVAG